MTRLCKKCRPIRCKDIPIKRYFLPLAGIIFLGFIAEVREMYYLPIIVFVSCFIVFWNFPKIVILPTIKPTYIDDLFVSKTYGEVSIGIPVLVKNKYYTIYIWSLITTSSVLMASLSDYWLTKVDFTDTFITTIGTMGGVISVYLMINKIIAKSILFFMKKTIEKQKIVYQKHLKDKVEMLSILNDEFKDIVDGCNISSEMLEKIKSNHNSIASESTENKIEDEVEEPYNLHEIIVDEKGFISI